MASRGDRHIGWKKEAAALTAGLLFGAAWEAAQATAKPVAPRERPGAVAAGPTRDAGHRPMA